MKRILAFICTVCPFCIAARHWPDSSYAKTLRKMEKHCPFCRAYRQIHAGQNTNP